MIRLADRAVEARAITPSALEGDDDENNDGDEDEDEDEDGDDDEDDGDGTGCFVPMRTQSGRIIMHMLILWVSSTFT